MNANEKIVAPLRDNATLVRPRFSPGLLLRDDDLRQGVDYTRDLSRLLMRSLFGCGVVCGLTVETELKCGKLLVTIDAGIGLTCLGDPVQVPKPATMTIDPTCGKKLPDELWVVLCRTEKCCAPRSAVCGCEEDEAGSVCTREHDQFEIRILEEAPDCACGCPRPAAAVAPRKGRSTKQTVAAQSAQPVPPGGADGAGTHDCRCADPCNPCYRDHYDGKCACGCCECLVLALLTAQKTNDEVVGWKASHEVRRFVRPVLMRDPQVWKEKNPVAETVTPPAAP